MAETLTLNVPKLVTLNATAGNVTEIILPDRARTFTAHWEGGNGWYDVLVGTDGAAKTADAFKLPGDVVISLRVPNTEGSRGSRGTTSVFIAGSINSHPVYLLASRDGE